MALQALKNINRSRSRYPLSAIPDNPYYQEWHFSRLSWQSAFALGAKPDKKTRKHAVSKFDIAIAWRARGHRQQQITHKQNTVANLFWTCVDDGVG